MLLFGCGTELLGTFAQCLCTGWLACAVMCSMLHDCELYDPRAGAWLHGCMEMLSYVIRLWQSARPRLTHVTVLVNEQGPILVEA
jgi:hypothetical protein